MEKIIKEKVDDYYLGKITSQKLVQYIKNTNYTNEEVYKEYFNIKGVYVCPSCKKMVKFTGFKKGFFCCKKCQTKINIQNKSNDEIRSEILSIYSDEGGFTKEFGLRTRLLTPRLEEEYGSVGQELKFRIVNDIKESPNCKVKGCKNKARFLKRLYSYNDSCCEEHHDILHPQQWSDEQKQKMLKTKSKSAYLNSKEYREKHAKATRNSKHLIDENKALEKRKRTCLEKYGYDNVSKVQETKNKKHNVCMERYGVGNLMVHKMKNMEYRARRKIFEKSGYWTPLNKVEDFKIYRILVDRLTRKNDLSILKNIEKRGSVQSGGYHLDHRFSIKDGFDNNIPPYIISNINNLEMLSALDNISKNRKSSISLDELMTITS